MKGPPPQQTYPSPPPSLLSPLQRTHRPGRLDWTSFSPLSFLSAPSLVQTLLIRISSLTQAGVIVSHFTCSLSTTFRTRIFHIFIPPFHLFGYIASLEWGMSLARWNHSVHGCGGRTRSECRSEGRFSCSSGSMELLKTAPRITDFSSYIDQDFISRTT